MVSTWRRCSCFQVQNQRTAALWHVLKEVRYLSIKAFSRSKISISVSVTSAWTNNGRSCFCISSNTGKSADTSATPLDELVVAPAGYSFAAKI